MLDHDARCVCVERVADCLHLRQNHAPLRRGFVNRRDQYDQRVRADEVFQQLPAVFFWRERAEAVFERLDALSGLRADAQDAHGARWHLVCLVENDQMRNLLFAEQRQKLRIEIVHTLCAVDDENGNVGLV